MPWSLAVEAAYWLALCSLRVRRWGFKRVLTWATTYRGTRSRSSEADPDDLAKLVIETARWMPFPAACLEISLTTYIMAHRRGIPVGFQLGCKPIPFLAHAWVTYEGRVITDESKNLAGFVPLVKG